MNESLKVKNFLVVSNADIEIKKINILIGRQANGKSVIAKLVYFFRALSVHFIEGIRNNSAKRDLDKSLIDDFEKRFPQYAWEGSDFEIEYRIDNLEVCIIGSLNSNGKTKLSINYSSDLTKIYNSKKNIFIKKINDSKEGDSELFFLRENKIFYKYVLESLAENDNSKFFSPAIFIPASRSFFANLQRNIFTFMASNLEIDPFLKEFGSKYENSKRRYGSKFLNIKSGRLEFILKKSIENIVDGKYEYEDDKDWIKSRGRRVNLINASSGQQEALPMLLTLAVWPYTVYNPNNSMIFIEEPEAHLFPDSQSRIVSMITALSSELNVGFFITTHSPYVLSAINNNILAGDVKKKGKVNDKEFMKMSGDGYPIRFEDVSAYTISNGVTRSIMDEEYRMVGAEILDEVSDHFQDVMNKLTNLEND